MSTKPVIDDYGHTIPAGTASIEGCFLEKNGTFKSSVVYKVSKYWRFYKEPVLYTYVETTESKKMITLETQHLINIICHLAHNCNIMVTFCYFRVILSYVTLNNRLHLLSSPFGKRDLWLQEALEYMLTLIAKNKNTYLTTYDIE